MGQKTGSSRGKLKLDLHRAWTKNRKENSAIEMNDGADPKIFTMDVLTYEWVVSSNYLICLSRTSFSS